MKLFLILSFTLLTGRLLFARSESDTALSRLQAHEQELTYRITGTSGDYEEHQFQFDEDRIVENVVRHHAQSGFNTFTNNIFCYHHYANNRDDCPYVLKQNFSLDDLVETGDSAGKLNFIGIPCVEKNRFLQWAYKEDDTAARRKILRIVTQLRLYISDDNAVKDSTPPNIFQAYKMVTLMLNNASCHPRPGMGHYVRVKREGYSFLKLEEKDIDQNTQSFSFNLRNIINIRSEPAINGCATGSERISLSLEDSVSVVTETEDAGMKKFYTQKISFVVDQNRQIIKRLLNDIAHDNYLRRKRVQRMKEYKTY